VFIAAEDNKVHVASRRAFLTPWGFLVAATTAPSYTLATTGSFLTEINVLIKGRFDGTGIELHFILGEDIPFPGFDVLKNAACGHKRDENQR
jgi:hypothetical protein